RDRAAALVGVGVEDDVALEDRLVEALEHLGDVRAELADHHAPVGVGDHRELVCCSRITGLITVRNSVASISKRVDLSAPSMMSSVTGSTSIFGISATLTVAMAMTPSRPG